MKSGITPSVWVTRAVPGNAATAGALSAAGLDVIAAPVLVTRSLVGAPLPAGDLPDWVVFVSANAVRGFEEALAGAGAAAVRSRARAAAVGRRTAQCAEDSGWRVEALPGEEDAEGLLRALLAFELRGRRMWIPSGNREGSATRALPEALAGRGALVSVVPVYETVDRPLTPPELRRLAEAVPGVVVFHSPSAVEAVFSPVAADPVLRWRESAVALAIGPATFRRLGELGARRMAQCREPSDAEVVVVVTAQEPFRSQGA